MLPRPYREQLGLINQFIIILPDLLWPMMYNYIIWYLLITRERVRIYFQPKLVQFISLRHERAAKLWSGKVEPDKMKSKWEERPGWWTKLWWTSRHSSLYRNLTFPLKWAESHHPPNAILLSSSQYQAISELIFCSRSQFSSQKFQTLNLFRHWHTSHYS